MEDNSIDIEDDLKDDSIDIEDDSIDMGYLVTMAPPRAPAGCTGGTWRPARWPR
jgi:hypothetical protein